MFRSEHVYCAAAIFSESLSLVCVGGKSHRKSQARFVRPVNNLTVGQDFRPGLANVSGAGYPLNVHDCMCFDDAIIRARAFTSHV